MWWEGGGGFPPISGSVHDVWSMLGREGLWGSLHTKQDRINAQIPSEVVHLLGSGPILGHEFPEARVDAEVEGRHGTGLGHIHLSACEQISEAVSSSSCSLSQVCVGRRKRERDCFQPTCAQQCSTMVSLGVCRARTSALAFLRTS